jgi:hypothetical protein
MPLDPDTAAKIAGRHGLGIADAASLRQLADTPDEAERIAARFANTGDSHVWLRHLFADDTATPPPTDDPEPPAANHVPREGNQPPPAPDPEAETRRFVRNLFGYAAD